MAVASGTLGFADLPRRLNSELPPPNSLLEHLHNPLVDFLCKAVHQIVLNHYALTFS